ncbi:unnamed protein product [Mucor hiemalis]
MVIMVNGVKHACASCIRGHRVKKCNHQDRELIPIVKRGRQVSQCNHCRDLRKTNHSHVKCTCAIASTPNPINGCLCEVILSCSCVAGHLQDVQEDGSSAYSGSPSVIDSPQLLDLNTPTASSSTIEPDSFYDVPSTTPTILDQNPPIFSNYEFNPVSLDDSELMNFLQNDLDKLISQPIDMINKNSNLPYWIDDISIN